MSKKIVLRSSLKDGDIARALVLLRSNFSTNDTECALVLIRLISSLQLIVEEV